MNLAQYVLQAGSAYGSERTAIAFEGQTWSYQRLSDEVDKLAAVLKAGGVKRGDRIIALMPNRPEYYVAYLGAAKVGAICATVNIDYTHAEIAHMVRHSEPKAIVTDAVGAEKFAQTMQTAGLAPVPLIHVERVAHGSRFYGDLAVDLPSVDFEAVNGTEDGVLLCYTSGTSGMPKPILTTHAGEIWAARSFRSMWRFTWNDRVLVSLPLAWVYGLGTVSIPVLSGGGTVVLLPHFRPDTVCNAIIAQKASVFVGVTTMYRIIVDYASKLPTPPDLRSLRLAMTGGERRNEQTFEKFEGLSGVPVHDIYACSEARPILGYDPLEDKRPVEGSAGILFPGVTAELRDDNGKVVAPGEIGELCVRSPNIFKEYYREPALTAQRRDPNGWVMTGDLFRIDDKGYWYIQGRKSADMINRSGSKVSPVEVEAHLSKHPQIREVVVVGAADPKYGEEVVACVVGDLEQASATDSVRAFCKDVLAEYKVPTRVLVLSDMPYGSTGKIDRRRLTEMANKAGA
jgi:long-chain acyl-CoA synthetase